jgi:hypothetical protein
VGVRPLPTLPATGPGGDRSYGPRSHLTSSGKRRHASRAAPGRAPRLTARPLIAEKRHADLLRRTRTGPAGPVDIGGTTNTPLSRKPDGDRDSRPRRGALNLAATAWRCAYEAEVSFAPCRHQEPRPVPGAGLRAPQTTPSDRREGAGPFRVGSRRSAFVAGGEDRTVVSADEAADRGASGGRSQASRQTRIWAR